MVSVAIVMIALKLYYPFVYKVNHNSLVSLIISLSKSKRASIYL